MQAFFLFRRHQTNHPEVLMKMKLQLYPIIFLLRICVFEIYTGMQNLTRIKLAVLFIRLKETKIVKRTATKQRLFDVILTSFLVTLTFIDRHPTAIFWSFLLNQVT